jgi:hypothetical protein
MTASVSAILSESYGIAAQPSGKFECPFCHHKTFSIKRDDLLGKCFHPVCGRFIAPSQQDGHSLHSLANVFEAIYHDFHQELLALKDAPYQHAYNYLITERQIHPRVVDDAGRGMVGTGRHGHDPQGSPCLLSHPCRLTANKARRRKSPRHQSCGPPQTRNGGN